VAEGVLVFKSECNEYPCRGGVKDRREGWQPGRRWKSNAFKSHCSELPLRAGRRRRGGRGATDCFQVFDGYGGGGVGPELLCLARGIRQARRSEGRAAAGFLQVPAGSRVSHGVRAPVGHVFVQSCETRRREEPGY